MPLPSVSKTPGVAAPGYKFEISFYVDAVRQAQREAIMLPASPDERIVAKVKHNFETACWYFKPKEQEHRIFVGDALTNKSTLKTELSHEQACRYVRVHFHHEAAHALFTERDLARVTSLLKPFKAPFSLFNLLEDARIEHLYRKVNQFEFRWTEYENLETDMSPSSLFFCLIQAEGNTDMVKKMLSAYASEASEENPSILGQSRVLLDQVVDFYARATEAKTSLELIGVAKDWILTFGVVPEQNVTDLQQGMSLSSSPRLEQEFEQDSVSTDPKDGPGSKGTGPKGPDQLTLDGSEVGSVIQAETCRSSDKSGRADKLVAKFRKLFQPKALRVSTDQPQKRISVKSMLLADKPYKKLVNGGKRKKTVTLIFDCSGSMNGDPCDNGILLLEALSKLAQEGYIGGQVLFSKVEGRNALCEPYSLPLHESVLNRIECDGGGEGLDSAIKTNAHLCVKSDYVFVYTDANITDVPIDKEKLHKRGIHTMGLYAGDGCESAKENMLAYFDKIVVKQSIEELVDAIVMLA